MFRILAGFTLLFFLTFAAAAETVQGIIKDPSGAVVASALITVRDAAGLVVRTVSSDGQGHFSMDNLEPGAYSATVDHAGFEPARRDFLVENDGKKLDLVIELKLQSQETVVEVGGKRSSLANSDPNYRALRDSGLGETFRIENVVLQRDAGEIRLKNGVLAFAPPVLGRVATAVFVGEGSFHLKPAVLIEAGYLQMVTGSPTFADDFDSVVFTFTDGTYQEIKRQAHGVPAVAALEQTLRDFRHHMRRRTETPRSLLEYYLVYESIPNVEADLLAELYNPGQGASFSAYIHGKRHHDLRFLIQPRGPMRHMPSPEEVALINLDPDGKEDGVLYLTHLAGEFKNGVASSTEDNRIVALKHYKIETAIAKGGRLTAVCDVSFDALRNGDRIVDFGLLPNLRVTRVTSDSGKDVSFIQEGRKEDGSFYAILPEAAVKGRTYTLHIEYEGNKVVEDAGSGSFFVRARTSWYPSLNSFTDRATFDLTFKVPKQYVVIGVGKLVKEWKEDYYLASEWVSDVPLAVAGFNYGDYKRKQRFDDESKYQVEAYATSEVPGYLRGRGIGSMSPSAMADSAIVDAMNSIRFFDRWFGELPYGRIAITQQPEFNFGQSWPTLVYLPVSAFLDSTERWSLLGGNAFRFADFIQEVAPHEVSHQWWGHLVGFASYHDQWLSEGFADFSASLFLQMTEKKPDKFLQYWERGRKQIVEKNEFGRNANDAGPLWMGLRLITYKTGGAYRRLIYPKGGYILHMLRQLMWDSKTGDQDFIDMMHDFVKVNTHKNASTEGFQQIVDKHLKKPLDLEGKGNLDWFFREWVYGTDLPKYRLDYSIAPDKDGKFLLTAKLTQSEVSDAFKMRVPIYAEFDGSMYRIGSVPIGGNSTSPEFKVPLPKKPKKIVLNANYDVLCSEAIAKEM